VSIDIKPFDQFQPYDDICIDFLTIAALPDVQLNHEFFRAYPHHSCQVGDRRVHAVPPDPASCLPPFDMSTIATIVTDSFHKRMLCIRQGGKRNQSGAPYNFRPQVEVSYRTGSIEGDDVMDDAYVPSDTQTRTVSSSIFSLNQHRSRFPLVNSLSSVAAVSLPVMATVVQAPAVRTVSLTTISTIGSRQEAQETEKKRKRREKEARRQQEKQEQSEREHHTDSTALEFRQDNIKL
jgi:hypothetical protein